MKARIASLLLMFFIAQGLMAQLISLGLVEESNIEKEIPNGIKRGYFYFTPELQFVSDNQLYAGTPNGLYRCNISSPNAVRVPTAALHHNVAAVFKPRIFLPSLKIIPAPKKPIPETTCAATLEISFAIVSFETETNKKAPKETNVIVLIPAILLRYCRSNPIITPRIKQTLIRPKKLKYSTSYSSYKDI